MVRILLRRRADPHSRCRNGRTPLMLAAASGHRRSAWLLLDHGARVNAVASVQANGTPGDGKSALFHAVNGNHAGMVRLLLDRCADVDIPSADGRTPLLAACARKRCSLVQLLVRRGASLNIAPHSGPYVRCVCVCVCVFVFCSGIII